ncbi:MAG: class I SAM-dependent methyltransferase [Clostridia bacterium]|nr:class I SAM-dependent methyltransferase [Clostridia bacterium]
MPVIPGLGWTFDTVAATYEKLRPGYVDALYQDVFVYCPLDASSRAVEVGIGGGQATRPILETGCAVTAVEPGAQFCNLCREKFAAYPKFSVINGKFEESDFPPESCDLVYSASAFHWVPEEVGYRKVFDILKPGGAFARFANHPWRDKGNPELATALDEAYAKYYHTYYRSVPRLEDEYTEAQALRRAEIAAKYGFTDIRYMLYRRTRAFSAQEYTMLLGTYSDHIALPEDVRWPFFRAVEEAIEAHGGTIHIYDTIDLQLARKP